MTTESAVREWRFGQTQAERLVAALLHVEGFEAVDPQHPLGGPDGLKDVLCRKNGQTWIAAAYFPPTPCKFSEIKAKFNHDFPGVAANNAEAIAFFVNQPLTVGERQNLMALAVPISTEIYHLERIRSLLDAPKGCGIRLEYLRIPMTEEEQWAFWNSMNQDIVRRLVDHEARRDAQIRSLDEKLDLILERTEAIGFELSAQRSRLLKQPTVSENLEMPTASLTLTTLCWLHRVVTEDTRLPEAVRGRLRSVNVWVGTSGSTPETASYVPPAPEEVFEATQSLLSWWRAVHPGLVRCPKEEVISRLAEFHHRFLQIHPFLDNNGRLSRIIVDQAARELLNQGLGAELTQDVGAYYAALRDANTGDMTALIARMAAALT